MARRGLQQVDIGEFLGPLLDPVVEVTDAPVNYLREARNVVFDRGHIGTREGHAVWHTTAAPIRAFHQWMANGTEEVIVYVTNAGGVYSHNIPLDQLTQILPDGSVPAGQVVFAGAGSRVYIAAPGFAKVWSGLFTNGQPQVSDVAPAPPPTSLFSSNASYASGLNTAGVHKFSVAFMSTSGSVTRPVEPVSVTLVGDKTAQLVFRVSQTPAWAEKAYLLMTTANNLERYYYVPGASAGLIPGQTNFDLTFYVNIPDETLAAFAEDATELFNRISGPPPGVFGVVPYGNRLCYVCQDAVYASEPFQYEAITLDQHRIELPGRRRVTAAFSLQGTLYICSDDGIFAVSDSGDVPASWAVPTVIASGVGVPSMYAVASALEFGYCVLATTAGLFWFDGGTLQREPINANQLPDWRRIRWSLAASTMQVVNDVDASRIYVSVPIGDSATANTHIMTFDYGLGIDPQAIRYSLDSIAGVGIGFMSRVWLRGSRLFATAFAENGQPRILRRYLRSEVLSDPVGTRTDNGAAIASSVRTANLPPVPDGMAQHRGVAMRATGSGSLSCSVIGMDGGVIQNLPPFSLSDAPGDLLSSRYYCLAPSVSYQFAQTGGHFSLSAVRHFFRGYLQDK